jgi:two-component sensor histidine kinase
MNINFSEYVKHLVNGLFQTYGVAAGKVASKIIINDISLGVDTAIPCGLVINELVSNSLKHAFPEGREGVIEISIKKSKDSDADDHDFKLTVKDNGAGIPENIDIRETRSLGLQLVTILAEHQLRGKIEIGRSDGTEFNIFFNELKYKKRI